MDDGRESPWHPQPLPRCELYISVTRKTGNEQAPARDEHGRLLPGYTANPNGRPKKGFALADLFRKIGDETIYVNITELDKDGNEVTHVEKMTRREATARAQYISAQGGNLQAQAFIAERTEGKVPDKLETKSQTTQTINIAGSDVEF